MSMIQPRLEYKYAQITLPSGRCVGAFTCSYEIPLPEYIPIPVLTSEYDGKYYNYYGTKLWYHDELFQNIWTECPSHNV